MEHDDEEESWEGGHMGEEAREADHHHRLRGRHILRLSPGGPDLRLLPRPDLVRQNLPGLPQPLEQDCRHQEEVLKQR